MKIVAFAAAVALSGSLTLAAPVLADEQRQFYIISHGSETDAFWVTWLKGAQGACETIKVKCNISFHSGDVSAQKEALNSAIAAKPAGIATTSAEPKLWSNEVAAAKKAGIPVVFFNTDDPASGRDAYVGANLRQAGVIWAQYLVDKSLVKSGDKVFLPVEKAGATYQVEETKGIASVFDPAGVKYEVLEVGVDPAGVISKMSEYMIANKDVKAIIGLGDLVTSKAHAVLDNAGLKPGQVAVVGWGNTKETAQAVADGYVNAGLWQYPEHQGALPVYLLDIASKGGVIGYDVTTLATYDKSTVDGYLKAMGAGK